MACYQITLICRETHSTAENSVPHWVIKPQAAAARDKHCRPVESGPTLRLPATALGNAPQPSAIRIAKAIRIPQDFGEHQHHRSEALTSHHGRETHRFRHDANPVRAPPRGIELHARDKRESKSDEATCDGSEWRAALKYIPKGVKMQEPPSWEIETHTASANDACPGLSPTLPQPAEIRIGVFQIQIADDGGHNQQHRSEACAPQRGREISHGALERSR